MVMDFFLGGGCSRDIKECMIMSWIWCSLCNIRSQNFATLGEILWFRVVACNEGGKVLLYPRKSWYDQCEDD